MRRARDHVLAAFGCPQAYVDLATLVNHAPNVTYIDIGCHHGHTIQRFLDIAGFVPAIGFDPSGANLRVAEATVRSAASVTLVQAALGDEDGRRQFFTNANEQTSSLLPNATGNRRSFPQDTRTIAQTDVDVMRLDSWAASHMPTGKAIIKCDTQGAEAQVVRGGIQFLKSQAIAFYGEVMLDSMYEGQATFEELRTLLEGDCGFVLRNLYPCLHDREGRAVQFDALWVPPVMLPAFA